ncbi:MAG: hypothetical protein JXB50_12240 [Spirochaetes bacterium]|nr:hypothetical protein [Spirochaetota bacterium]
MKYERPYKAGSPMVPGYAAAQGSDDNTVIPADGSNDFIGAYEFENQRADKLVGENLGVVVSGLAKVIAGGDVTAGKKAVVNAGGKFINCPATAGTYKTVGTFLESGSLDQYVDIIIERASVTVS